MKKSIVAIIAFALSMIFTACAANKDIPISSAAVSIANDSSASSESVTSSQAQNEAISGDNEANVQYREVETIINGALTEIKAYEKPKNVIISSTETAGIVSARIEFMIADKGLRANLTCTTDTNPPDWSLAFIAKSDDLKHFYWVNESAKKYSNIYDFETDELIQEAVESLPHMDEEYIKNAFNEI